MTLGSPHAPGTTRTSGGVHWVIVPVTDTQLDKKGRPKESRGPLSQSATQFSRTEDGIRSRALTLAWW